MPNVKITPTPFLKKTNKKKNFKFHDLVSWLGALINVPPETVFSLCHLDVVVFSPPFPLTWKGTHRQRREGGGLGRGAGRERGRGLGEQIALGIT